MEKFRNKYRIASTRLQNWDYGSNAMYFVTICTQGRECYFGKIADGKMELSGIGIIADILWHEIKNHAKNVELGEFVVMPNHIHGILVICGDENRDNTDNRNGRNDGDDCDDCTIVETTHALSLPETIGQQRFQHQGANTMSSIIGSYKSAVSKHAHRLGFDFAWQSRFHDHIIRNGESFQRISDYIRNNPSKWTDDKFYGLG